MLTTLMILSGLFLISVQASESICLNMIVKNESHVIRRALDSIKDQIDYWVIVDTGSTDGTQTIIRESLKDVPGELFERPWKNFAFNRNEALGLARGHSDYILFLDADDWFLIPLGFKWPKLDADAYQMWWVHQNNKASYLKPQLIKANLPWRWEGVIHEYLVCSQNVRFSVLDTIKYRYGNDGARSQDPEKYTKAAAILEEALREEPKNSRYQFYLAESYRCAGLYEKALASYRKAAEMKGWDEEVFWAILHCALLQQRLKYPRETIISSLITAHRFRPYRAEPVYFLAEIYNQGKEFAAAYACIKGWEALPKPAKKDILFNLDWTEDYGIDCQLSICSYYVGKDLESLTVCDALLSKESLPEPWRKQIALNRKFPLKRMK